MLCDSIRVCIYLLKRTRRSAEVLVHAIPDANVEPHDTLDVTSLQRPPPSIIVSPMPASATTTEGHVFLPSSLFRADAGVMVDMANKPAEMMLLRPAKTVAVDKWHLVVGIKVLLE
jgi:pentafunctional AROM polypeptide